MGPEFVTSKDGTKIAYEKLGKGPAVILVGGAMVTRKDNSGLADLLAHHFTVYNYDRRGRGDSTDTKPFSVEREIEDIAALIDQAGDSVNLYGISSGAALALQAAARLGIKIKRLALYEAPYTEEGAVKAWQEYRSNVEASIAENRRGDAVVFFMKYVGLPDEMIAGMKNSPMWPAMEAVAPTLPYDAAALGTDGLVPTELAATITAKTLVMDGGASLKIMPFMHLAADKLSAAIPNATRHTIEGQGHDISPDILAPVLTKFFG